MPRLCPPAKIRAAMTVVEDDLEAGLEQLAGLSRKYAKDPTVRFGYGAALLDAGRPAEALQHLEFVERRDASGEARETLLEAYFSLGMVVHAERLLQRSGGDLDDEVDTEFEMLRNHGPAWRELPRKDLLAFERARVAAVRRERGVARELERLVKRHPTWTIVRTALAGTHMTSGDLNAFYAAADASIEAAPDDAVALLHASHAALLRHGTEAARAFRDRLDVAHSHRGVVAGLAARADAAAVMNDEGLLRTLLNALDAAQLDPEQDAPADAQRLYDAYERRASDPSAPLVSIAELLFGVFGSWVGRSAEEVESRAGRDLARAPGLLRELPLRLGYEDAGTVRILASALLSADAPPAPQGTWGEVLTRIATEGPGTRTGRTALLGFLHEMGEIDASDPVPFAGTEGGVSFHGFEVTGEPVPSALTDRDQKRVEKAMRELTSGRVGPPLAVLSELVQAYPDEASLAFNLAVAERLAGRDKQARKRLERLVETHPDYLFARAQLAVEAIDAGDPDRAEELLVVPEGRTRLHVIEWATFAAALGRLALARGDVDAAEDYLRGIDSAAGQANGPYRMLEDAIDAQVLEGVDEDTLSDVLNAEDPDGEGDAAFDDELRDVLGDGGGSPDASDLSEAPSADELAALPLRDEAWHLASSPVAFAIGEDGAMQRMGMLAIAEEDGIVRTITLHEEPLDGEMAYGYLALACSGGMADGEPGRPRSVVVDDPELVGVLLPFLRGTGIAVAEGDALSAREVITGATESMGSGVPAWLSTVSALEARTFVNACEAFYGARTWDAFAPDRPLAFRVGGDAWRYATLMGHGGEEFGMAVFQSWSAYEAFLDADSDVPTDERLTTAGAFESVSLSALAGVSPLDAPVYLEATDARFADDPVPHFVRFERGGLGTPSYRPAVYAALLTLLAQRAGRVARRIRRIDATLETQDGPLRVRYPATGAEEAEEPGGMSGRA